MAQLIHLDRFRRELALATDISEVKELHSKAEALRQYAKKASMSLEEQNRCAEIKLYAERRAVELYGEIEREPGRRTDLTSSQPVTRFEQCLTDDGVNRMTPHRWQAIASIPEDQFIGQIAKITVSKRELTSAEMYQLAKVLKRQRARASFINQTDLSLVSDQYRLMHGDFGEVADRIEPESIDAIISDPPYSREFLPLYETLARVGAKVLKPEGSMLVMVGQSYLPEILALMTPHLRYNWTLAYLTPGCGSPQLWQRKVRTTWKPVLWFVKEQYQGPWLGDVAVSEKSDKSYHDWGQSETGMATLVKKFTDPGQLVLDPCCGAGTTGVVAVAMKRRFIGIDIDASAIQISAARLKALHTSTQ